MLQLNFQRCFHANNCPWLELLHELDSACQGQQKRQKRRIEINYSAPLFENYSLLEKIKKYGKKDAGRKKVVAFRFDSLGSSHD